MPSWSTPRHAGNAKRGGGLEPGTPSVAERIGDFLCTQPGCGRQTGLLCEYVDRRGRACRTGWCPEHRLVIDGRVYCRRHAGVVSALPAGFVGHAAPLPDLDNRSPSLVSWVAREVDADIRELLLTELGSGDEAQVVTDPVYPVFTGSDRRRGWERAWKIIDGGRSPLRISLLVEECADAEVAVRVNADIVERLAPPWIVQRLHGSLPPPEVDAQRRKDFNRRLLGIVRKGVERERHGAEPAETLSLRLEWGAGLRAARSGAPRAQLS
ncbi:MAG TPA: hypothetical protein VEK76_04410 [Candidatus Binatia bacterium]|nr:hypothetical protein [Candidatus Binatia bacterium]